MIRRILLLAAVSLGTTIAVVSGGPHAALAHANLESSDPARGEVVPEMPSTIELVFSQEVARSGGLPEVIVVNSSGDQVDLGATLNDDDRTLITIEMPPAMPDGRYTVIWHTQSDEDGEEARGAFDFFVGAEPTEAPPSSIAPSVTVAAGTPTPAATIEPSDGEDEDDDDSSGVPFWALFGGIAAGAAIGFAGGMTIANRRGNPTS